MNMDNVRAAQKMALAEEPLRKELVGWHQRQGTYSSSVSGMPFKSWVKWLIERMAEALGIPSPSPKDLVDALRVSAVGDFLALCAVDKLGKEGFSADINCSIEDGKVDVSISLDFNIPKNKAMDIAKDLARRFGKLGYWTNVWSDDEWDYPGVIMDASLGVAKYVELSESGKSAESLLFGDGKCYNEETS